MRIVSWNMNGRSGDQSWRHLLEVLQPDIALLQEARPNPSIEAELGHRLVWQPITGVSWGTAIVSTHPATPVDIGLSTPWMDYVRIAAVDIDLGSVGFRAVSVHPHHQRFDPALLTDRPDLNPKLEGATTVWSCDVAYALASQLVGQQDHFAVGGDWNTARLFDTTMGYLEPGAGAAFFARAEEGGWHDCYFTRHGREGRTWFRGTDHGYQLDHIFMDRSTGATVTDCWIDERAAVSPRLSDHAPLIVDTK